MRRNALFANITTLPRDGNMRMSLYRELRNLIAGGYLRAGSRLPSSRALARDLGIARNSVLAAFERLAAEGFIVSRRGSGSYVSRFARKTRTMPLDPDPLLRASTRAPLPMRDEILPAVEHFPLDAWQQCMRGAAAEFTAGDLSRDTAPSLQRAIAEHVAVSRGVRCEAERVLVFASKRQAIETALRLTTDAGDAIISTSAADLLDVPSMLALRVGADGRPRVIHAAPVIDAQDDVLQAASRAHAWVLEDDLYGHFATAPALYSLDRHSRVIYLGTFADVLNPLDISFLILPPQLASRARSALSPVEQHGLARFIAGGYLAAHVRRLRAMVGARRQLVIDAIEEGGVSAIHAPLHVELPALHERIELAGVLPPNVATIGRRIA